MEQVRRIGVDWDWKKPEDPPPTPNSRFYRKVFLLHLFLPRNIGGKEVEATRKYRKKLEPFWAQTPTCISPHKDFGKGGQKNPHSKSPPQPSPYPPPFPLSQKKISMHAESPPFLSRTNKGTFPEFRRKRKEKK